MAIMSDYVSSLINNPVFQLSLSSKELFHSNFLYWLAKNEDTRVVFQTVLRKSFGVTEWEYNPEEMEVLREHKHFDFCICTKKSHRPIFVLENKFKSVPYLEQLKVYEEKACKDNACVDTKFVLLTLANEFLDRESIEGDGTWKIVPYDHYAAVLRQAADAMSDCFDKGLIIHYCNYVSTISEMVNDALKQLDDAKGWDVLNRADFEEIRCNDLWQKMVMHRYAQKLTELVSVRFPNLTVSHQLCKEWNKENEGVIHVVVEYYHSQALVEIIHLLPSGVKLCIQQQGPSKLSVGILIPNDKLTNIDNAAKAKDKSKWNNAVKARVSELNLTDVMPIGKKGYNAFLSKGKEGFFYVPMELEDHSVLGTLDKIVELTAKAITISSK